MTDNSLISQTPKQTKLITAASEWAQVLPTLSGIDWILFICHYIPLLGILQTFLTTKVSQADVLVIAAMVIMSRARAMTHALTTVHEISYIIQATALIVYVRTDHIAAIRIAFALFALWMVAPPTKIGCGAAEAAIKASKKSTADASNVREITPAEIQALRAADPFWCAGGDAVAPASSVASTDSIRPFTLVALHTGLDDPFMQTFRQAAVATSESGVNAVARGPNATGPKNNVTFVSCDVLRWPKINKVLDVDTGFFSMQLPSVFKFEPRLQNVASIRLPKKEDVKKDVKTSNNKEKETPKNTDWLRRMPHVYDDGETAASVMSLTVLQKCFQLWT
jgi:hypothetical protein